ncbi:MAG: hypothetical protein U0271_05155 [Polyangiaceae bacterium]
MKTSMKTCIGTSVFALAAVLAIGCGDDGPGGSGGTGAVGQGGNGGTPAQGGGGAGGGGSAVVYADYDVAPAPASVTFTDVCGAGSSHPTFNSNDEGLNTDATPIAVPFPFHYYDSTPESIRVSINGWISFSEFLPDSAPRHLLGEVTLPDASSPNGAIYALWEDLRIASPDGLCYGVVGDAPNRSFIIEWDKAGFNESGIQTPLGELTFEIVLNEGDDTIDLVYDTVSVVGAEDRLAASTTGIENEALVGAEHQATIGTGVTDDPATGTALRFTPVPAN